MKRDRITFYKHDGPYFGYQLVDFPAMSVPDFAAVTINDAIEYYQIKQFFDQDLQVPTWTKEEHKTYKKKSEKLFGLTMRFFNGLSDETIIKQNEAVELTYHSSFWALFVKCRLYDKISVAVFEKVIHTEHVAPDDLFRSKELVQSYGLVLKQYILENFSCIRTIIHVYEQELNPSMEKLFLPAELTGEERRDYFDSYIESDQANANVLREIQHLRGKDSVVPLTDEIRLKAKRKFAEIVKLHFRTGIPIIFEVAIAKNIADADIVQYTSKGNHYKLTYNEEWLLDTLDYPSIMNNFIYAFEYADWIQFRFNCVSKKSDIGVLEQLFLPSSKRYYVESGRFQTINNMNMLQMNAYYSFLEHHDVHLEDVIKWVFTEYFQREFKCSEMRIVLPSPQTTFAEKCGTACLAIESILKQFSSYVENREIDFELLAMSSGSKKFDELPSMIAGKNLYGFGEVFKRISLLCFSNQYTLHVDRIDMEHRFYDSFLELIKNECVYLSDYQSDELDDIMFLQSKNMITVQEDGRIVENMTWNRTIIQDLYINEGISRWHYPKEAQETIQDLIDNGICKADDKLLLRNEVSFLNYMLNNVEFCNGHELRNGYAHGILQVYFDEEQHRRNYMNLLRILVLLAIKINDEFCLQELIIKDKEEQ